MACPQGSAQTGSEARLEPQGDGRWLLCGRLDFDSVAQLEWRGQQCLPSGDHCAISLAGVTHSNSAGVALLLAWQRWAHQHGHQLQFVDMPTQLAALIELSGLATVIHGQ